MTKSDIYKEQITKAINAFSQKKFNEAEEICLKILSANNNPDANHILGCIRMSEGRYDESITLINNALSVNPDDIGTLISLGCALSSKKDHEKSIVIFKKIISLKDDISQVHFYLGESYRQVQNFEKALTSFKRCLSITPDHIGCQLMIGIIYEELKKFDQAISFYKSCIETYPDYIEPHINLGMCLLLTGNYNEGWHEYEWRLKLPAKVYEMKFIKPKWTGQDLLGKKLLIVAEQSIGETFQYIRFAKLLAMEGAKIIIMAQPEITNILRQQEWITDVIEYDDKAEYDYYTYLISIAKTLEWSPDMDTQKFPYIKVNDDLADKVNNTRKNIGIMIKADKNLSNYNQISVPKDEIDPIFEKSSHNIIDLSEYDDFDKLAEVIKDLDLVVSIESDIVHLAGSLNIPVWLMLSAVPKHTWDLSYKNTSPWYPSLMLFRQESRDNWTEVVEKIKENLTSV